MDEMLKSIRADMVKALLNQAYGVEPERANIRFNMLLIAYKMLTEGMM